MLPFRTDERGRARRSRSSDAHLAQDGLLAYPTETVYGLGSAPSARRSRRSRDSRDAPPDKPFLLLVSGRAMARGVGPGDVASARGALGGVLARARSRWCFAGGEGRLPDELRGKEGGIAVRHTSHRGIARLVAATGRPLTSTSANRPGGPPAPGPDRISRSCSAPRSSAASCWCSTAACSATCRPPRWWTAPARCRGWCGKAPSRAPSCARAARKAGAVSGLHRLLIF